MNFELTEEQLMIQQTAREFAESEIAPSAVKRDIEAKYPTELLKNSVNSVYGMMVSPQYDAPDSTL